MQTELKAVEILKEILENEKQAMAGYEKLSNIAYIEEALAELAEITQEKSCETCRTPCGLKNAYIKKTAQSVVYCDQYKAKNGK